MNTQPRLQTSVARRALIRAARLSIAVYARLGKPHRGPRQRRGMALMWAMVVFAVLTVTVVDFMDDTRVNYALAVNQTDDMKAYFNARSGIELQKLGLLFQNELSQDPFLGNMVSKSNFQVWEVMSYILPLITSGELKTPIGSVQVRKMEEHFDGPYAGFGSIDYNRPEPEEGKININAFASHDMNRELLQRFCHMIAPPQWEKSLSISDSRALEQRFEVIAAIVDYVDPDNDESKIDENCEFSIGSAGGESSRYRNVKHLPKNQPLTTLGELRLVPGVTDAFMEQFGSKLTVYPIADNALYINQADATVLLGFLCSHFKGSDKSSSFTPCKDPQIAYEVSRIALALDGYIRFFQNPLNVLTFYLGGMGGLANEDGRLADGVGMGQMQAFRRPQQLQAIVQSIMTNPQFEFFFISQADRSVAASFELDAAIRSAEAGFLPPFNVPPESFDYRRMAANVSTATPKVFTLVAEGSHRNITRRIRTVVDVSNPKPQVLYWREY